MNRWAVSCCWAASSLQHQDFGAEKCGQLINQQLFLIFMDPCIVNDSVEIPTRCNLVIEFIIPMFIEGSTCLERHTAHHQEL